MQRTIQAVIRRGEQSGYVAQCPALNAVTEGATLDLIALALEGEDLGDLGFAPSPVIVVSFD